MSREWLFIQANDVLMFRDSKPFAAGQNFKARSMFPPTPRTMQGVIRSHYLEIKGVDWYAYRDRKVDPDILKAVGGPGDLGNLKLTGPFVAQEKNGKIIRLVRTPLDLLQPKDKNSDRPLILLAPEREPTFQTNAPFEGWRALRGPPQRSTWRIMKTCLAGWRRKNSKPICKGTHPQRSCAMKCCLSAKTASASG